MKLSEINNNLFKGKESYKHRCACDVLEQWINERPDIFGIENFVRTEQERLFSMVGGIMFRPDITVYNADGVYQWYEVCHTNPVSAFKLNRMQWYLSSHKWEVSVFEIKAEYILRQVAIPLNIKPLKLI